MESALQQRLDPLVELLERGRALDHLAVDEEGGSRADLQHLMSVFEVVHDLLSDRWIVVDAGLYGLLGGSGLYADPVDGGKRSAHQIVLRLEQRIDQREIFPRVVAGDATRHGGRSQRDIVEREFAEDVAHFAGVDIFRLDLRKYGFVEMRAMRTGHRCEFGDRHRCVGGTERHVRQRHRFCDIRRSLRHRVGDEAQRREAGECGKPGQRQGCGEGAARDDHSSNQLFSSGLITLSKSSNETAPLTISPLMKKLGVELTLSTSAAYFWSAAILSSSAWSFRQVSTPCSLKPACLPIRFRVSVVFFKTQSFCCRNSMSMTAKYLPESSLAMQRASIEPAAALMSSGNSRNT